MTEEKKSDISIPEQQPAKPVRTFEALLKLYSEGHRNFSGSDLRGATVDIIDAEIKVIDFRDIILRGSNLKAIKLRRSSNTLKVDLAGSDLSECNFQGADISYCRFDQCNFTDTDLRKVNFTNSSCRGSDFIRVKLLNTAIGGDCTAANFTGTDLRSTILYGDFSYANFCSINFQKASFANFHARGADFSNANLQDVEFPTPKTVNFEYAYYNHQTKFSDNFDPISRKMELIQDNTSACDSEIC
jgi:uncharacterized protein YjbI with pentapeptide repeats